jgi:type IV pilus assembly protein PilN
MSRPHINLLPHRQEKRARRQREANAMMVFAFIAGLAIVGVGWKVLTNMIESQQSRNAMLERGIKMLEEQIKEIDKLQAQIKKTNERRTSINDLQRNRSQSVHLLDQMLIQLPEGLYLQSLKQKGNKVTVVGYAQSNAHVSAFMRKVSSSSWLNNPVLLEIKLTALAEDRNLAAPSPDVKGKIPVVKRGTELNQFTLNFDVNTQSQKDKKEAGNSREVI